MRAELEEMRKAKAAASAPKTSESALRLAESEAEQAKLRAELEEMRRARAAAGSATPAPNKSDSALKLEQSDAENAKMRAELEEMRRALAAAATASASKSASAIRHSEKEAQLAGSAAASSGRTKPPLPPQPSVTYPTISVGKDAKPPAQKGVTLSAEFELAHKEMKIHVDKARPEVKATLARANSLDLVIVMDCTGSMDPWIEAAKTSIITIIDNVKKDHPNAKVLVGFVAYRDFCDGDKRLQAYPLSEDIESVRNFIGACEAFGGGDEPEGLAGALECALMMKFDADGKRVVVVTDAPCHGGKFHNSRDDQSYATEITNSPDICKLMKQIARHTIDFTIVKVKPQRTAKMTPLLENSFKSKLIANGLEPEFQRVELKDAGDAVRFASIVRLSAGSSLQNSKSRSVLVASDKTLGVSTLHHYGPTGKRTTPMKGIQEGDSDSGDEAASGATVPAPVVKPLVWDEVFTMPKIRAVRHSFHFLPNETIDWTNPNLKHTKQQTTVQILPTCFAKGAMRSAHAMYDCKLEIQSVAKCYFGLAATSLSPSSKSDFSLENEQIVAKQLATEFSLDPRVDDTVDFIFTCWYEIEDPVAAGLHPSVKKFTAEPYIGEDYVKYNSNQGWACGPEVPLAATAQAFSHFTWQATSGRHLVVDLQGVGSVFTDPQIHSTELSRFGQGNLAKRGMTTFFSTHERNDVCRALELRTFDSEEDFVLPMDAPVKRELSKDKSMTCSCPLCGAFLTVLRSEFLREHAVGREIYCSECTVKLTKRERRKCVICKVDVRYKSCWFEMKGVPPPTSCKICREKKWKSARSSS